MIARSNTVVSAIKRSCWAVIVLVSVGCPFALVADDAYPRRPIKLIVPFAAGGGTDTFARTVVQAIDEADLLSQPIVIINVPGASGTIGSRRVKGARPDGYTLLCLHEAILTAQFAGKVNYGPEAFEPIAGTGSAPLVVCVGEDSPFASLSELMTAAEEQPDTIVFSANIGAPSYFAGLMLEKDEPDAKFRFTQNGGGAKRFAAIVGGHVDASAFSLAEYSQFASAGLTALAVCSQERHPDVPELPTAVEQGFDCVSENTQFWWAPKGTSPERTAIIASAIKQAMQDPKAITRLRSMSTEPLYIAGDQLTDDIAQRTQRLESISTRPVESLPNIPMYAIAITCLLGIAVATDGVRRMRVNEPPQTTRDSSSPLAAAFVLIVVSAYVVTLQNAWLAYPLATTVFTLVSSVFLMSKDGQLTSTRLMLIAACSLTFAFALNFLLTSVLVLDLP